MNKPLILVMGATGKTGTPVVEQLLERAYLVRAMVRRLDERSERLAGLGAEIVIADFHDLKSLREIMQGVSRAYFCYPPTDRLVEATTNVAIAARDEGMEALVNMSQISALEFSKSHLAYQHWQSEQILDWAGIGASHVRPTFFAEDIFLFTGASIAAEGKMYLPFGDNKHAPVAAEDIARVVVGMLENPQDHVGERYVITGPKDLTMTEAAQVLSKELGRPIEYIDLPVETWKDVLVSQPDFDKFLASHLAAVAVDHQNGVFSAETDVVSRIGGQAPLTLAEFVRANRTQFTLGTDASSAA